MNTESGYTLLELLLVLAIIGIAAAIAAPTFSRGLDGFRAKSAVRLMKSGLDEARTRAIREKGLHYAVYNGKSLSLKDEFGWTRHISLPEGIESAERPVAVFYPTGSTNGAEFEVRYGSGTRNYILNVFNGARKNCKIKSGITL